MKHEPRNCIFENGAFNALTDITETEAHEKIERYGLEYAYTTACKDVYMKRFPCGELDKQGIVISIPRKDGRVKSSNAPTE